MDDCVDLRQHIVIIVLDLSEYLMLALQCPLLMPLMLFVLLGDEFIMACIAELIQIIPEVSILCEFSLSIPCAGAWREHRFIISTKPLDAGGGDLPCKDTRERKTQVLLLGLR